MLQKVCYHQALHVAQWNCEDASLSHSVTNTVLVDILVTLMCITDLVNQKEKKGSSNGKGPSRIHIH